MSPPEQIHQLAFIGAGNMATALVGGLLADGFLATNIHVADPLPSQLQSFAELGVCTYTDNNAAIAGAQAILLAVKPQLAGQVVQGLTNLAPSQLLISIAAGINSSSLQTWAGPGQPIVRCMPNTPALVGAGITALYANPICDGLQRQHAEQILAAAGATVWVAEEQELDAVTALSGSGPAYFFLLMEAMIEAGTRLGLSQATATQLTLQTAYGAALMARQSEHPPGTLRDNVTSPGGTTAAALEVMQQHRLPEIVNTAVAAAERRAGELAEEFGC